jgi:hypothetical protein
MPTPIPNIWQLQIKGDVDGLIASLRHSESSVRKGAVAALRTLGAWQAVPAIEAALAAETDWQVHAVMMTALQYLDRDIHIETMIKSRDIKGLSKMLNSPKVEDLLTACAALGQIGDRQGVEPLIMAFRNPMMPNKVKLAAAEALLQLESAPAVVTLLGALRRDNWQVRRNAAAVLGQLQAVWATEPLIKAMQDENIAVQKTAVAALQRFGTPEAVQAVKAYEEVQRRLAAQQSPQPATPSLTPTKPLSPTGALRPTKPDLGQLPATGPLNRPSQPSVQPVAPAEPVVPPEAPTAAATTSPDSVPAMTETPVVEHNPDPAPPDAVISLPAPSPAVEPMATMPLPTVPVIPLLVEQHKETVEPSTEPIIPATAEAIPVEQATQPESPTLPHRPTDPKKPGESTNTDTTSIPSQDGLPSPVVEPTPVVEKSPDEPQKPAEEARHDKGSYEGL